MDYIAKDAEANAALNRIRAIMMVIPDMTLDYSRLPELHELMAKVKASHDAMPDEKRKELPKTGMQCMPDIHQAAVEDPNAGKKQQIAETTELVLLDGLIPPMRLHRNLTAEWRFT